MKNAEKKKLTLVIAGSVFFIFVIFLVRYLISHNEQEATRNKKVVPQAKAIHITLFSVKKRDDTFKIKAIGIARPIQSATLRAETSGKVKSLPLEVGEKVPACPKNYKPFDEQGRFVPCKAFIARLDGVTQKALYESALAGFEKSQWDYKRSKDISEKTPGIISPEELKEKHRILKVAKAILEQNRHSYFNTIITAPLFRPYNKTPYTGRRLRQHRLPPC